MSKLKWTFDLKQHTPMIHFQPYDEGVCLRATEVKPKFDRFLLEHKSFSDIQKSRWFYTTEDGRLATKMKLRFRAEEKAVRSYTFEKKESEKTGQIRNLERQLPRGSTTRINRLYFGNQGCEDKEDYKETVFFKGGIKGTVLCFDGEFLEIIKRYIPEFFLLNNFGTRQNKGFGSFSVVREENKGFIHKVISKYEHNAFFLDYNMDVGRREVIPAKKRLDDIGILYGLMKGGINNTEKKDKQYYKSAIFRYYLERGIINEKKVIKQELFDEKHIEDIENARYVRAVLGLTDGFAYKDAIRKGTVSVSNDDIKRYQSPVYFKVLDRYTFLFLRPMPEALRNAEFEFSLEGKKPINLPVPDFDIEDFMAWFARDFNNKGQIVDPSTRKLVRGSLTAADNDQFARIELLNLRRYT